MERVLIEEIRRGHDGDGLTCGPVSGSITAEVKVKNEKGKK